MWGTYMDSTEVDVEELAPELLRAWLGKSPAIGLMDYLWNGYLNGREVAGDELGGAEDALSFLAIAKVCAGALEIAADQNTLDAWDWVEAGAELVHPFILGYLLASRDEAVDFEDSHGFHLSTLIDSYQGQTLDELAKRVTESDFFIAIWSAHLGIEHFPPRAEDMADHGFHLDELKWGQGPLLEHAGNLWPRTFHAPAADTLF